MKNLAAKFSAAIRGAVDALEPFLPLLIAFFYFVRNKDLAGLQYNTDEFGYLSKMIFLSGRAIIYPSQWQFGYSLLLLPVAWLTKTQSHFWYNFVLCQSLIWCAVFYLLRNFITFVRPGISRGGRFAIVLVCALYPSWCIMTGYAFTTTLFVFMYMAVVVLICRWNGRSFVEPLLATALTGLLYWAHSLALAVFVSILGVLAVCGREEPRKRAVKILAAIGVMAVFVVLYKILSSAIDSRITDVISPPVHYSMRWKRKFDLLLMTGMSFSHFSTLGLTTLGAGFCGFAAACHQVLSRFFRKIAPPLPERATGVALFCALCVLMVVGESVVFFCYNVSPHHNDYYHWLYCRYVENCTLPLLALCFLVEWRKVYFLLPALSIFAGYLGLYRYAERFSDNPINTYALAVKNVCGYFTLLRPFRIMYGLHLLISFLTIAVIGLFARFAKTRTVLVVLLGFCGIVGIGHGLKRHADGLANAREWHRIIRAAEKARIADKVTWDSYLRRRKRHVTYYEFTHFSYPRAAFWKAKWRQDTTENWLKDPRGILITDQAFPLLFRSELFLYRTALPPGKYLASVRELPGCADLAVERFWSAGRPIPARAFVCRYDYPLNERVFEPRRSDIYFRASSDAKYLHLKLTAPSLEPFYLNGQKLVPLTAPDALWQCFDVSGLLKSHNVLKTGAVQGGAAAAPFRVAAAMIGDRIAAETEFFTRRSGRYRLFATAENSAASGDGVLVRPGQIQFGPYIPLPPGCWEVRVYGSGLNRGVFDISYKESFRRCDQKIEHIECSANEARYLLSHKRKNGTFEFRCHNRSKNGDIRIDGIRIRAVAVPDMKVNDFKLLLNAAGRELAFGKPLFLAGDCDRIGLSGFYTAEPSGRWAGAECVFDLPVPGGSGIEFAFSGWPLTKDQSVRVVNRRGEELALLQLPREGRYGFSVPAKEIAPDNTLYLRFEFPRAARPKNGDARVLSFFFRSIEVSRMPTR